MSARDNPSDPSAGTWAHEALAGLMAKLARQQAEAEAHAASCKELPCDRCQRYVCRCGVTVEGEKICRACADAAHLARMLKPTRESIPSRFRWGIEGTVESLMQPNAAGEPRVQASAELIRRGLEQPPSAHLLMLGPTGSGKTTLAAAMLDAWVRANPSQRTGAIFVEAAYLSRARARYKLGDGESPLVESALECPLLVLDDLGNEANDRDGCITDVVWGRTNHERPMWITCGLGSEVRTLEELVEVLARRYDGAFARRLIETMKRVCVGRKSL